MPAMTKFETEVFKQGLQMVRTSADAIILADMLTSRSVYGASDKEQLIDGELLGILIDHERKKSKKPDFINIFMTLGTIQGKEELSQNAGWIEFTQRYGATVRQARERSLNRLLDQFKRNEYVTR
jgi:hypothetical protein